MSSLSVLARRRAFVVFGLFAVLVFAPGCDSDEEEPEPDSSSTDTASSGDTAETDTGDPGDTDGDLGDIGSGECPATEPIPGGACGFVGQCEYGMECCGEMCGPSYVCTCDGTIATNCLNTDIGLCEPDMSDTGGDGDTSGGPCRSDDDCSGAESCARADANLCGNCQQGVPCDDASTCAANEVCSNRMLSCPCGVETVCAPACTTADDCTRSGDICDTDGECKPESCVADADCSTPQFVCDTAASVCVRADCTADADCPTGGVCVNQQCAETEGVCVLPVP